MRKGLQPLFRGIKYILFFAWLTAGTVAAQSWTMMQGDTVHIDACSATGGVIYDDGGPDGNYSNNFNGWVVIEASSGVNITLSGNYYLESPSYDYIYVYDGNTNGTVLVNRVGYEGSINVTATSGRLTLYFHTDVSVNYSGFALTWSREGWGTNLCSSGITQFDATSVTSTTATLNWTAAATSLNLDYGQGAQTVSGSSTTLTGLNSNTVYNVKLYADGELANPCCVARTSFRTACGIMAAPMVERFDDLPTDTLPPCWSMGKNFDDENLFPHVTTTAAKSGTKSLMLSSGQNSVGGHWGMAIGPCMSAVIQGLNVHVSLRSNIAGASVELGICDTTSGLYSYYGFIPVDTLTVSQSGQWYDFTIPMSSYTGDGCRLAFRMIQSMQPGANCMIYIDDIMAENCGVDSLQVFNAGHSELTISWSGIGDPTVDLTVTGGGTVSTYNGVTSPYTVTGLEPATSYTLTLTPRCGGVAGEPKSTAFSTLNGDTLTLQYCQDFEAVWPANWYLPEMYSNHPQRSSDGGYVMRMYYYYGTNTTAVMPRLTIPVSEVKMTLRMRPQGSGSGIIVGVMDYPNEMSSFTPVDTLINSTTSYQLFTADLTAYSGNGRYLALRTYSPTSNNQYIYVDDISVGRCLITGLKVSNATHNSVTLEWDYEGTLDEVNDSVIIEYGAPNFTFGSGTRVAILPSSVCGSTDSTLSYLLAGLDSATSYQFAVYRQCSDQVCNPPRVNASTQQRRYTVPFCENFDGVSGDNYVYLPDWSRPSMFDSRPCLWQYGSSAPTPNRALEMHSYGPLANGRQHSTAVLPHLDWNGNLANLVVNFYTWFNSDNYTAYLEVGVITDPNDESTFTPVDTVYPPYRTPTHFAVPLAGYNGGDGHLALRYYHSCNYCYYTAAIDNLEVRTDGIGRADLYSQRSDGATLEWETVGNIGPITLRLIHGNDTTEVHGVTSPYSITGLQPGETYRYELDYGQCYPVAGTFATRSEAVQADWCYGFETSYSNGRFEGWRYPVVYSTGNGTVYRGSYALSLGSYNTNSTAAILPYIEETDYTNLKFTFWARHSSYCTLIVGLVADPRDTAGMVPLLTVNDNDNVYRNYEIDLTGHEADGHHLIFLSYNHPNSGCYNCTSYSDIDQLRLDRGNRITARSYTSTATTADITWGATQASDSVRILLLNTDGTSAFDSTAAALDSLCHIENLTPGTTYTLHLEAFGNLSYNGCDLDPIQLRTLDHDVAAGYCERCEGPYNTLPEGWTWLADGGRQPWNDGYSSRFQRYIMALHADSRADAYTMVISPRAAVPLNTIVAGFGAWYNGDEGQMAGIIVAGVITNPTDASTFTALDTFRLSYYIQHFAIDLSSYSGTGRYLAFKGMSLDGYDRNIWLTDITLSTCLPTRLRTTEVTSSGFNVRWNLIGTGDSVRIVIENLVDTTVLASTGLCHISGLQPAATYQVRIIATCQPQELDCQWQTIQVNTLPVDIGVPSCITMNNPTATQQNDIYYLPNGWTRPYGNRHPRYSNTDYLDNIEFYAYSCNNSSDMESMVVSPWFPEGFSGNWLDFYFYNSYSAGRLVVGSMTDPYDTSTFVAHDTIGYSYPRSHVSLDLNNYSGNYLAFRYLTTPCNSSYAYISNLSVMHCPLPDAWLSHQEDTSVWVNWAGTDPVWIEYQMGGEFTNGDGERVFAATSPAVIGGLASAASYTFHVWPQCGTDTFLCNYDRLSLTTMHPPVSMPYCYNFESLGDWGYPEEWSRWNPDGTTCAVTTSGGHDDSRSLHLVSSSTRSTAAILPKIEPSTLCTDSLFLNFWSRLWSGQQGIVVVGTVSDISDTNAFTTFDTIVITSDWQHHTTSLPRTALLTGRAAFRLLSTADVIIDNLCLETCVAADVEVSDITQHTATITWSGYGVDTLLVEYGRQGFAQGTGTVVAITTSPYTITGLSASSDYNFIFRTVCSCPTSCGSVYPTGGGTGGSTWWDGSCNLPYVWIDTNLYPGYSGWGLGYGLGSGGGVGTGGGLAVGTETQAEMLVTPYCEDFDTTDVKTLPAGWRRIGGSTPGYPQTVRTPVLSGARSMDLYTTTGYSNHLALPPVANPADLIVAFNAYTSNAEPAERSYGVLTVGVMSDPDRGNTFVPIDTVVINSTNKWGQHFVDLSPYSGDGQYIAFRFTPRYNSYHVYIDNVYIGSCAVTSASANGSTLNFTTIGAANGVIIEDTTNYSAALTATGQSLPSIDPEGHYELTVRAYGDRDTQSDCHIVPIIINPVLILPFCEDFDAVATQLPAGWTVKHYYSSSYPNVTGGLLNFHPYNSNSGHDIVLLPELANGDILDGLYVGLQYEAQTNSSYNFNYTYLDLGYLTDTNNWSTFVTLTTLQNNQYSQYHSVQLPSCGATRLALRARSTSGSRYFGIDRLVISSVPMPVEGDITSPEIGYSDKVIRWNSNPLACHYQYEWGTAGYTPGTGTLATSDSCGITLHGLDASSDYDVYFIDSTGHYSCSPYRFTTSTPTPLPLCEDFNTYGDCYNCRPTGWSWEITEGSFYCTSSYDYSLYFYASYYNNQYFYAAMPEFEIDSIKHLSMHLRYQYRDQEGMAEVGVIDTWNDWNSFAPVDTLPCNLNNWSEHLVDFSSYNGTGRFVAIRFHGNQYQYNYLYIDRIDFQDAPLPSLSPTSSRTVLATLDSNITVPDYWIEICASGATQGTGRILHVTSHNYVIDSLEPESTYDIYTRRSPNLPSCYHANITTPPQLSLPYCEDFNTYGDCYNCRPQEWSYNTANDDQNYTVSGNNWSLRFYSYYYNTHYVYAALPDFDVERLQDISLELRYRLESSPCVAELGVMSAPTDWNSFVPVDTFFNATNTWYTLRHDFHDYVGNGRFIAIRILGTQYQYNYLYLDYIRLQACPLPAFSLASYNTVKCAIDTSFNSANYWVQAHSTELDTLIHVTTNPFFITGLNPETEYTFTGSCDSASTSCFPPTVITTGVLQSLPYCENFNTYGSGESCYPPDWGKIINCGDDRIYTTSNNNYSLYFRSYYYNQCDILAVLPDLDIDSIRHTSMKIRYRFEQYSCPAEIGVMTDPADQSTFVPIHTFGTEVNTWYIDDIDLSSYTSDGRYIAIRMSGSYVYYKYLYIDYIYLQAMPLVHFSLPEATTVVARTDSSQTADYWLHYTQSGSNDTTHIHATSTNYRIENLNSNSIYHFLATVDSTGESCWPWTSVATSQQMSLPHCDNFESYQINTLPTGWLRQNRNADEYPRVWDGYSQFMDFAWGGTQMAILPEISDVPSTIISIDIMAGNMTDKMIVGVMTDATDINSFTPIDTLEVTTTGTWQHTTIDFSQYSEGGHFVAFLFWSSNNSPYYFYFDNLVVESCDTRASAILSGSNVVQITSESGTGGFYVEYGPVGFEQGTGTSEYIDITPYDISLNHETTYDFYFKCSESEITCHPKQTLTTLAPPIEISYCESFETYSNNSMPDDWIKLRMPSEYGNDCYVANGNGHQGSKSLIFYSAYTDRRPYAVMTEMQTDSLAQLAISFWMQNSHCNDFWIDLGTMSNPYDESTFIPLRQFRNNANNVWQRMQTVLTGADINANFLALRFSTSNGSWDYLYIDDIYIDTCGASDLQIIGIESESVTLDWRQTGNPNVTLDIIPIGDTPQQLTVNQTPPYNIGNLNPLTSYMIRIHSTCSDDESTGFCSTAYIDSVRFFTPAGGTGCIDPTNLTADYVTCFSGSYRNPYGSIGMVDSGAASAYSRHTIHYNPSERDPRTGNLLRTVPDGAPASVRLGNWGAHKISDTEGGEAEAITYALFVDTMAFDLLIMKYAAVMQDPMHDAADQPRFRLELLDQNLNLIDSVCGAADFIANQNLGWNTYGEDILWKDWTTVGLDMSTYAGQTVYIRLTTYDCNEGSHYGYAYFTLDCMRKSMTAEGCGNVTSNVFTAPSGFAYRWYSNQSDTTFSTAQNIDVASNNNITYYCDLSFIDNAACNFTMSAFAGTRFPLSLFDSIITINNCQFEVAFNNHSTISMDGINPVGSGEGVETAWWTFGNGATSNNYHASTVYTTEGTYTVTLITAIAAGACTDTMEKEITLVFPPTNPHIEGPVDRCYGSLPDTLTLLESQQWTVWTSDTIIVNPQIDTTYTLSATDSNGCVHIVSHTIAVHPIYDLHTYDTICDGQQYSFSSETMTATGIYPFNLYTSGYGCDSTHTLHLIVNDNTTETINDTVNETELPHTFNAVTFTDSTTGYIIHTTNAAGCDSTIIYNLAVIWNPRWTDLDSTVCRNALPIVWNNISMTDSGIYTALFVSSHGQDSTVTMHLHTVPVYDDTIAASICDNELFAFEDSTYYGTYAGLHSKMLATAIYGCDSLRTLNLEVRATSTGDTIADECDTFYWYGNTYTTSTEQPTHTSTNAVFCDSTTTLHLTIRNSTSSTIHETIVENDLPYTFNGVTFTDSTDTTMITIANAVGCDSVINYSLSIDWNTGSHLDSNVCFNQLPITWNNELFDTTAMGITMMRTAIIPSVTGSDSTIIMRVHVRPIYSDTIPYSICDNEQYTFEDSTFYGTDAGLHSHMLATAIYGCDSLRTLNLDVRATTTGDTIADECDTFYWYGNTYTTSTEQPTHLSTNAVLCDSTTTLHLTIRNSTSSTIHETIVENDLPYTFNGVTFTDSTDATVIIIQNAVGCDSVINYKLSVDWNTGSRLDSNVCFNQLPITWNNELFDTTAMGITMMRTAIIPSVTGSDSTIIMRVHVRPIYSDTIPYSICDNEQYTFEDSTYYGTDAGLHSHMLATAIYGCDSLRTLNLDVRATTTGDTIADECDTFYWYGNTYTASTEQPTHISTNAVFCDSTTTLHLTIRNSTTAAIQETIVENDLPYTFNGTIFTYDNFGGEEAEIYDDSTTATVIITNTVGCDSIINYTLHVDWNTGSRLDSNVCFNLLPVTWNNEVFDTTAMGVTMMRTVIIPAVSGSDSTIVMRVHVRPVYSDTVAASICNNEQYTFEDSTYYGTDAGLHSNMLATAIYGCDSLRTLNLDVRATTTGDTLADECDTFFWYGTAYTASTEEPTHLSTNAALCDSTTTLHLTIRYSTVSVYYDTVIENLLPHTFNGVTFSDSVSHTSVTIANAVLCDSVIDYSLYVHWNVDTTLYDTLCNDALPITWNGQVFDTTLNEASGTLLRSTVLTAHTGADSTVWMYLTVHPLFDHHLNTEICDNQSFAFGDSIFLGTDGTTEHLDSLLSQYGCDSLSTLHLTVHPTFDHHLWDTVCSNHLYTWGSPQRTMLAADSTVAYLHGNDTIAAVVSVYPSDTSFTDHLQSVHGCDSLSSLYLHLLPAYSLHYYDTICDAHILSFGSDSSANWQHHQYRFEHTGYDTTGVYRHPLTTGTCDSTRTLHLKVYPTYDQHLYDTIYDGDSYTFEQSIYDTTGVYPHTLSATFGCDSLRTLHLQRNRRTYNDSTLCQNLLPLVWNNVTFSDGMGTRYGNLQEMADSVHLQGLNGIDSLVVMTVTVRDTSSSVDRLHGCDSLRWQDGVNYTSSTAAPFVIYTNAAQCDSVVHLALTVDYTHWATDRHEVCDSMRWIDQWWYYADTLGVIDTIRTVADCDSIVTLDLTVHYATSTVLHDTMCYNQTYTWHGFSVQSDSTYLTEDFPLVDTLQTIHGCDSVVGMIVTKMALPKIDFIYNIDCQQRVYNLSVNATAPLTDGGEPQPMAYTIWSSVPTDQTLDGQERLSSINVAPQTTTDYILFADYRSVPFCPTTSQIQLSPIIVPQAEIKVNPEALGYDDLTFTAYDISHNPERERAWYVDWLLQDETGPTLYGTAPVDADSVSVALRVYNGQCYDTALRILPIHRVALFAPNVFTPLRDNNNLFTIVGQGIIEGELFVYNREGLLVHHTDDYTTGWNGRRDNDGRLCLQGNYVWKLVYRATDRPDAYRTEVGTVLLIK